MKPWAFLAATVSSLAAASAAIAAPAAKETVVLQRAAVLGTNRQLGMDIAVFPPIAQKSWHKATGPEIVYVLAGELTMRIEDRPQAVIRAGESYRIPAKAVHQATAGPQGAQVLAAWIWAPGSPFNIPVTR